MSNEQKAGFLLIDKPIDWTSHDVVAYVRGIVRAHYRERGLPTKARRTKVGHAGTLDPFATGLLIVGVGREATKRIDEFKETSKIYEATLQFGAIADTYDRTGQIRDTRTQDTNKQQISNDQLLKTLKSFVGVQKQVPPMYSAKKIGGKKLYELARKGVVVEREPSTITIFSIELVDFDATNQTAKFTCEVSTGTYIRTLVHDIGATLGVGAYTIELRRTSIGMYSVEDAIEPKSMSKNEWETRLFLPN